MTVDWKGQQTVIIGAARQGLALARYLARQGASITITDLRSADELNDAQIALESRVPETAHVEWVLGSHPLSVLDGADWLFVSGGVPLSNPLVVAARETGIAVTNDSQVFMEIAPCTIVGITGSAGKTTTTSLVGQIASESALPINVWIGGNIGTPLIDYVDQMQPEDLAVVEFSSFQLELMTRSPQVAAVLNVTPNHLDRHESMQAYSDAKARILEFQSAGDMAILGRDDPGSWALLGKVQGRLFTFGMQPPQEPSRWEGTCLIDDCIYLRLFSRPGDNPELTPVLESSAVPLRGEHNLMNVLAACAIAAAAGLSVDAMRTAIKGFRGVPHRLEFVRTWGKADWYNDSIATAPERAMAAIRSFDEPLVLLAGGRDKNLPWASFADLVLSRVDHLIVFGEAADKILLAVDTQALAGHQVRARRLATITRCQGLQEAVQAAAGLVQPGDVVLLSPGGTSFDEFKDFEERGECFSRWVEKLP